MMETAEYMALKSGQRVAGQPTCNGGAAARPDLLELAHSGRVGAKSVSEEEDFFVVLELLQRAESGYEAVRPLSTSSYPKSVMQIKTSTPTWLARARNHAEAIDKAFRFRLAFLRRLNERMHDAGVDVGGAAVAGVTGKVSTSDGVGRLSSELLALCKATFR
eukprot:jgi/Tetstr1/448656/TSEL_035899.t1